MDTEETTQSVGSYLKQARESANLSCVQAADSLRLRVSVIRAIEADKLEMGVPMIFIRGYIKNYARLLNIKEASILPFLEDLQEDNQETEEEKLLVSPVVAERYFNWQRWLALTVLVLGGLLLLIYFR